MAQNRITEDSTSVCNNFIEEMYLCEFVRVCVSMHSSEVTPAALF